MSIGEFDFGDKDMRFVADFRSRMNATQLAGQRLARKRIQCDRDFLSDSDVPNVRFGDRDLDEHLIQRSDLEHAVAGFQRHTFGLLQVAGDHQAVDRAADFKVLAAMRQQFAARLQTFDVVARNLRGTDVLLREVRVTFLRRALLFGIDSRQFPIDLARVNTCEQLPFRHCLTRFHQRLFERPFKRCRDESTHDWLQFAIARDLVSHRQRQTSQTQQRGQQQRPLLRRVG